MTHRWVHEDEYLTLKSAFRQAQKEGDEIRCQELRPRIEELDRIMWRSMTSYFTELKSYNKLVEALEATALSLKLPFPDLNSRTITNNDGQFFFGIADGNRTVQIWPLESRGYYSVEVFDYEQNVQGFCYRGTTTSLEDATIALSRWFVERCSIEDLHFQLPWLSTEPFHITGPRMILE